MHFLADESCDFIVVATLRNLGHDVTAIVETKRGADDETVLTLARSERRVLVTEDKDFGVLAYADGHETGGVILIRFPAQARVMLPDAVAEVVRTYGERLTGLFVVLEPGRARLSRPGAARRKSTDK